jgi:hypothetical protein
MAGGQARTGLRGTAANYDNFVIERRHPCGGRHRDRKISAVNRGMASLPCQEPAVLPKVKKRGDGRWRCLPES